MTSHDARLVVREVAGPRDTRDWLRVPAIVHAGDPAWVQPLDLIERQRISPRHNAFFASGEAAFFVAWRNGAPVGRISAQINRRHLERYRDGCGHFGFFCCIDDEVVAMALHEAASRWLAARGAVRVRGPYSLSINEESGLLVDGFDSPPAILMGHAPPWLGGFVERCGYRKAMDLYAFRMRPQEPPARVERLAGLAGASGRVRVRNMDMARFEAEIGLICDLFNDAWNDNWGFVPFGEREIQSMASDLKPLMRSKFSWFVEIDGAPAAFMVVLPDLNRVVAPFGGQLLPFNWARLAFAIWQDRWKTARVPLLGIRRSLRHSAMGPAVLSLLASRALELGRSYDLDWVEFSWVLETNEQMRKVATFAAGDPVKTYRLYEKELAV